MVKLNLPSDVTLTFGTSYLCFLCLIILKQKTVCGFVSVTAGIGFSEHVCVNEMLSHPGEISGSQRVEYEMAVF